MTCPAQRKQRLLWIDEAMSDGARFEPACIECDINPRTIQRWKRRGISLDQRTCVLKTPHNKLDEHTRQRVLATANGPEYADMPPSQIVPKLADSGHYIASESTMYRVLKEAKQLTHRHASRPKRHAAPKPVTATALKSRLQLGYHLPVTNGAGNVLLLVSVSRCVQPQNCRLANLRQRMCRAFGGVVGRYRSARRHHRQDVNSACRQRRPDERRHDVGDPAALGHHAVV